MEWSRPAAVASIITLTLSLTACGDDETAAPPAAACPAGHTVAGVCAGVPAQPVCEAELCTGGVTCSTVAEARDDGQLQAALATAAPGSCIALAPGTYTTAALPAGVSLLGKAAASVSVGEVTVAAGEGAVVRGMTVGAGGITIAPGATGARVEAVRVLNSAGDALTVGAGSELMLASSELVGAGDRGLLAMDSGDLEISSSVIEKTEGPGIWMQCAKGCDCPATPLLSLSHVVVRETKTLGISVIGGAAMMNGVEVADIHPKGFGNEGVGGIAASGCANLVAKALRVVDSDPKDAAYGVLIDASAGKLGGDTPEEGVDIIGNKIGLWIQNQSPMGDQPVELHETRLEANRSVGIGMSGGATGIIWCKVSVKSTTLEGIIVEGGASDDVGDGVSWQGGAQAQIEGLQLSGNARASILIDGDVGEGSSLKDVELLGGDETKGIVQQGFMAGGVAPSVSGSVPALEQTADNPFTLPQPPESPAAL